ncbi:ABC transporter permease [Paenibacillus sp. MBLB4367]|uniref:ABC transporter permease n=1 Tax=Paenibacillus sp. MBLB4367 TaxID=3384767 RepID=UPI0039081A4D
MVRLSALLRNENLKIYRRPRTWIMLGLLLALLLTGNLIEKFDRPAQPQAADWKQALSESTEQLQKDMESEKTDERSKIYLQQSINMNRYAIEHDINPERKSVWTSVDLSAGLIMLGAIFTIVIAGDIVAGEFSWGTIKLLLIRPVSRGKILLSKYVATLLFALFLLCALFLSSLLIGGVLYGFDVMNHSQLYFGTDGNLYERSMAVHTLQKYGFECVSLVMTVTVGFMISTVFRSSSLAIGLSIGLMFGGSLIVMALSRYEWVKYVLFANLELSQYLPGRMPIVAGMTLGFSVTVLAVYFIVLNALSWFVFTKRDVAG